MEHTEITQKDGRILATLPKRFAYTEAHELKNTILDLMQSGEIHFIIDFGHCEFIDSIGLGTLVTIYKRCLDLGGSVTLSSLASNQVKEVFHLTKLDQIFTIS